MWGKGVGTLKPEVGVEWTRYGEGEGGDFKPEVRVWRMGSGNHKTGSGGGVDRMWGTGRAETSNRK